MRREPVDRIFGPRRRRMTGNQAVDRGGLPADFVEFTKRAGQIEERLSL
jgi:hypothetical protein